MTLSVKPPEVGNEYVWLKGERCIYHAKVLQIESNGGLQLLLHDFYHHVWTGTPMEQEGNRIVTWTPQEWEAAGGNTTGGRLNDYLPPVKVADLKPDEELCRMCNGSRWERTRDSDVLPCMWCGMSGKQKKAPPPPPPTHSSRSELHPPVPIERKE